LHGNKKTLKMVYGMIIKVATINVAWQMICSELSIYLILIKNDSYNTSIQVVAILE